MPRAAKVHAVDWGSAVLGIQRCGDKLSLRDRTFGEFFALLKQLRDSLLFPVRRQNMCLVGTLTIRGLLSSLVPSSVFIVLRFSQGYWSLTEEALCERLWTFEFCK